MVGFRNYLKAAIASGDFFGFIRHVDRKDLALKVAIQDGGHDFKSQAAKCIMKEVLVSAKVTQAITELEKASMQISATPYQEGRTAGKPTDAFLNEVLNKQSDVGWQLTSDKIALKALEKERMELNSTFQFEKRESEAEFYNAANSMAYEEKAAALKALLDSKDAEVGGAKDRIKTLEQQKKALDKLVHHGGAPTTRKFDPMPLGPATSRNATKFQVGQEAPAPVMASAMPMPVFYPIPSADSLNKAVKKEARASRMASPTPIPVFDPIPTPASLRIDTLEKSAKALGTAAVSIRAAPEFAPFPVVNQQAPRSARVSEAGSGFRTGSSNGVHSVTGVASGIEQSGGTPAPTRQRSASVEGGSKPQDGKDNRTRSSSR